MDCYKRRKDKTRRNMDFQQFIDTLGLDKSIMEDEVSDIKTKIKLYERLIFVMLGSFAVVRC